MENQNLKNLYLNKILKHINKVKYELNLYNNFKIQRDGHLNELYGGKFDETQSRYLNELYGGQLETQNVTVKLELPKLQDGVTELLDFLVDANVISQETANKILA